MIMSTGSVTKLKEEHRGLSMLLTYNPGTHFDVLVHVMEIHWFDRQLIHSPF